MCFLIGYNLFSEWTVTSRNERECRDDSINMNDNDYEEEMAVDTLTLSNTISVFFANYEWFDFVLILHFFFYAVFDIYMQIIFKNAEWSMKLESHPNKCIYSVFIVLTLHRKLLILSGKVEPHGDRMRRQHAHFIRAIERVDRCRRWVNQDDGEGPNLTSFHIPLSSAPHASHINMSYLQPAAIVHVAAELEIFYCNLYFCLSQQHQHRISCIYIDI